MNGISLRRRDLLLGAGIALALGPKAFGAPSVLRRIRLFNANTSETFEGVYRDAEGPLLTAMSDLSIFLRDHHENMASPIHVETIDFLADAMDAAGQSEATILSGYRTPQTNAMLAEQMFHVAEKSEHMAGRALDVTFASKLETTMRAARTMKRGGVGWYPGSHFIHVDSGPVRNWTIAESGGADALLEQGPKRPLTVKERIALQRELARRQRAGR